MPPWDRFRELCHLQFGPPVRGTRLAELARLPFTSTVHEYSDRFKALQCHARNLSAPQKAELYVGGLPEHIRVDVELRDPQDLQTAKDLARAFERRAAAMAAVPAARGVRPPPRAGVPPSPRPPAGPPAPVGVPGQAAAGNAVPPA
jgi:hypothetical protein